MDLMALMEQAVAIPGANPVWVEVPTARQIYRPPSIWDLAAEVVVPMIPPMLQGALGETAAVSLFFPLVIFWGMVQLRRVAPMDRQNPAPMMQAVAVVAAAALVDQYC